MLPTKKVHIVQCYYDGHVMNLHGKCKQKISIRIILFFLTLYIIHGEVFSCSRFCSAFAFYRQFVGSWQTEKSIVFHELSYNHPPKCTLISHSIQIQVYRWIFQFDSGEKNQITGYIWKQINGYSLKIEGSIAKS